MTTAADKRYQHATAGQRCKVCGCTDVRACRVAGLPCCWVLPDLCSACALEPFLQSAASLYWLGMAARSIARELDRGREPQILRASPCE